MKKLLLSIFLCNLFSIANAGTSYMVNFEDKKIPVISNYEIKLFMELTDLNVASMSGDTLYLKSAIEKDPEIIKKINNLHPATFIGFSARNFESVSLVQKSDKDLFNRKNHLGRNILLDGLSFYYNDLPEVTSKMIFDELLVETDIKNTGFSKKLREIYKVRNKDESEELFTYLIKNFNPEQLNSVDIFKNSALHLAVYNRLDKTVNSLFNNSAFKQKTSTNMFEENALFMLLSQNCNVKKNQETDILILNMLLKNKLNPLQTNKLKSSFAAIVMAIDDFKHLRPTLLENLNDLQKKMIEKDVENIKNRIKKYPSIKNVQSDYYSVVAYEKNYNEMGCGISKKW